MQVCGFVVFNNSLYSLFADMQAWILTHALVNVSLPLSPKQNDVIQKDFSKLKSIVALFWDSVFFLYWCRF